LGIRKYIQEIRLHISFMVIQEVRKCLKKTLRKKRN